MKKIKLKERDITKIIGMVLKEQDLSKIEWYRGGKHESWFQYYNTFNGCRSQFTNLLKKLVEYFGEKVTQEANQLIVSFKRGMIQVKNKRKDKLSDEDKNIIVSYLKPEFERIGIEFLDEDQKELDRLEEKRKLYQQYKGTDKRDKYPPLTKKERLLIEKLRKKKELVDTALWDYMFMLQRDSKLRFGIGASIYRTCAEEYMDAKRKYETQIDDDRDYLS